MKEKEKKKNENQNTYSLTHSRTHSIADKHIASALWSGLCLSAVHPSSSTPSALLFQEEEEQEG